MKRVELLSPVGNMETLPFAVHNGADAVYFAGKKFGARKFANNFNDEEIVEAIKYCHLYSVKVYITVNTLIYDEELKEVLDYIDFLYRHNVDALIIQDIGLIKKVRELYPDLEIHVSTQSHNHNSEGLAMLEKMGVKRAVLARELTLDEIQKLDTKLEKEVFVHGALCVCYSGCCLFSSMNGGRSANRGECVASCRLPYQLYKNDHQLKTDGEYLLSTKDLNTLAHIKELIEAGIDSFKIEGRMKSPEYVGFVTKLYRTMIDHYYDHQDMTVDPNDLYDLKKVYNREFTDGYLFTDKFKDIMNPKTPNHIGVEIGEVISYDSNYIKIKLSDSLNQEDGIRLPNGEGMILNRLYDDKMLLVNSVSKGCIAIIDNKINLNKRGTVLKTTDKKLMSSLRKLQEKKIPIAIIANCQLGQPLELILNDGKNTVKVWGSPIERSKTSPMSEERMIEQLTKLGNTPFVAQSVSVNISDQVFVSIKEINELRRQAVSELISLRQNAFRKKLISSSEKKDIDNDPVRRHSKDIKIAILVRDEKQLKTCLDQKVDRIYTDSKILYDKYKNTGNVYYRLPRVMTKYPSFANEHLVATELGAINKYASNNDVIADYTINAFNHETINFLVKNGCHMVTISPEVTLEHLKRSTFFNDAVEYIVYGTMELMIMKYCPIKLFDNVDRDDCHLCSMGNDYYLKDNNGHIYPIINTKHFTHIMHHEPLDNIKNVKSIRELGINNLRVELLKETPEAVIKIIDRIRKEVDE